MARRDNIPLPLNLLLIIFLALGTPLHCHGDRVKILYKDEESISIRADMIRQAKSEILVGYFIVRDDETSVSGFALLLDAADRGVKVKVMLDAFSQSISTPYIRVLTSHPNIEIRVFNKFSIFRFMAVFKRSHEKFLIADNRYFDGYHYITGGRNVSNKYFGYGEKRNFNDLDVYVKGESALVARNEYFKQLWESEFLEPISLGAHSPSRFTGKVCAQNSQAYRFCERQRAAMEIAYSHVTQNIRERHDLMEHGHQRGVDWNSSFRWDLFAREVGDVRFLFDAPQEDKSSEGIADQLFRLIMDHNSVRKVVILSPYVILTGDGFELVETLRQRGVDIVLVTNSLNSTDNILAQAGYANNKAWLLAQGVEIYHYIGPDTIHAKAAIINDGESVLIGTYNFDPRSASLNREIGTYFHADRDGTGDVVSSLHEMVNLYKSSSRLIGPDGIPVGEEQEHPDATWGRRTLLGILRPLVAIPTVKKNL